MKRVFFVDYENVDTGGLDGLSKLATQDEVYIFYSEKHSRMTFGLHRRICDSKSSFLYRKVQATEKNALDKELMKEAEIVVADKMADYYIISKDKGYKSFIQRKVIEGYKIDLFPTISETNQKKKEDLKKIIKERLVSEGNLDDDDINRIATMIMNAGDKQELNRKLQEMFYNEDVKHIFSMIKDITYKM